MTEHEWLTGTDPMPMLQFLRGRASDRKLRLFAHACCRRVDACLTDQLRASLTIAEEFADGRGADHERKMARRNAMQAMWNLEQNTRHARGSAKSAVSWALAESAQDAATGAVRKIIFAEVQYRLNLLHVSHQLTDGLNQRRAALRRVSNDLSELLRHIVGNPFRPASFDPAWRTPSVLTVVQGIYDERRFADMPVLADALEEAGCTSAELLAHCRNGGEHVRGCWALDLVLAKK